MDTTVRALRGVCIGPERHLAPGETASLDAGTARFLAGIGAVEVVPSPAATEAAPEPAAPAPKSAKQTTKEP